MQIVITIDNDDADQCPDTPWSANLVITDDDGRVSEGDSAGIGATVHAAVRDLMASLDTESDHGWLPRSWRAAEESQPRPGDDFVIVEGGLVQNDPSLPVFDLDVLTSDAVDEGGERIQYVLDEIEDLRDRMLAHPDRKAIEPWLREVEKHAKNV